MLPGFVKGVPKSQNVSKMGLAAAAAAAPNFVLSAADYPSETSAAAAAVERLKMKRGPKCVTFLVGSFFPRLSKANRAVFKPNSFQQNPRWQTDLEL